MKLVVNHAYITVFDKNDERTEFPISLEVELRLREYVAESDERIRMLEQQVSRLPQLLQRCALLEKKSYKKIAHKLLEKIIKEYE